MAAIAETVTMEFRAERCGTTAGGEITMDSPMGPIRIRAQDGAIVALEFVEGDSTTKWNGDSDGCEKSDLELDGMGDPVLKDAAVQLREYIAGARSEFDLPLRPRGTEFQRRVWAELQRIPYGTAISYGEMARRIGQPTASRAVGLANGRNPIAIVIPCHRVIGADGSLTGYASGVERKKWLLDREGVESRG